MSNIELKKIKDILKIDFTKKLKESNCFPIKINKIDILQLNITKKCNLSCKHCHLKAGPTRTEIMSKEILEKCLELSNNTDISTIDITGGAPELNPHLEWFINQASKLNKRLIVRSNLVILKDNQNKKYIDIFTKNKVEIFTSLPDFNEEKSNRQRGDNFFKNFIEIMLIFNKKGYGIDDELIINLVHNPVGVFLPASQFILEKEYKKRLFSTHGIKFNNLFCLINMPVGRYLEFLNKTENLTDYFNDLCASFNPGTVNNIMCKTTLNVGWDGKLYNCDFNQALSIPIDNNENLNILNDDLDSLINKEIIFNLHCFGCTAGSGSSCQGSVL